MNQLERFSETISMYLKHGWQLRRVLMTEESARALAASGGVLEGPQPEIGEVDALWFARPSHGGREAWELRLVAETPYALFETFEADEEEEARRDVRLEMEARLRAYVAGD